MKIAAVPTLEPGDRVEASITHEIKIGGETSWIKYGVSSKVRDNETAEDARARVSALANEGVMKTVFETVETVRSST